MTTVAAHTSPVQSTESPHALALEDADGPGYLHRMDAMREAYLRSLKAKVRYSDPQFQNVSVHDPSILEVDDTFYIFGSHLAAAKSVDLVQWERFADGVNAANPLFDNALTELEPLFDWSDEVGLWANEVFQLDANTFYMYPNLSRLDSPRASLGLAIASDVEGPYEFQGIFLQSGMWGEISDDGENIYDATVHPNTVDPDVFWDQQGVLWMIYGSYSGGIFILEMDPSTGFPLPGQGYGTHLMGGNHSRIEGAFVLYSPHSGYYYMFVSFGGLDANGGYNIRVSRSLNAEGPYFDALGNDMADVKSDPDLPLFDDESIEPFAQKLMHSNRFERHPDEPNTGSYFGYQSPGHNSAIHDPETGRYFLVFHTRFPGFGETHQVRVHEFFINEDGWPVVAPHRYVPYSRTRFGPGSYSPSPGDAGTKACLYKGRCTDAERVAMQLAAGEYKLINHEKDISAQVKESELVTLTPEGRIDGAYTGRWHAYGHGRITLLLTGEGLFRGVRSPGWNPYTEAFVATFTAQSAAGVSIWGSRVETP